MTFIQNVDYEKFDDFVRHHKTKSHFMQSPAWGEHNASEHGDTVHRTALIDDSGEIKAAALMLERRPARFFPPYLYCPRGYVCDFSDKDLVREMTDAVRNYAASLGAMFVAIDPDVERRELSSDGEPVAGGFDNSDIVENLISLGYRHKGWTTNFGRSPRFTFRIDLTRDRKDIEKSFTGNIMKNVRKSHHYAVRFCEGSSADIPILYSLLSKTADRDDFVAYKESYYQSFYDSLAKDDMSHVYLGYVDPSATVVMLRQELAELLEKRTKLRKEGPLRESAESEARLLREIELFEGYAEKYPGEVPVSAHLVVRYGDKAWAVHAGSLGEMNETFCNNRVYYEKLMAQKDAGCVFLDMFGTEIDERFRTVHEFKKQWGGRLVEFIGEFDLVTRPFWFFLYEKVRPMYRNQRFDMIELMKKIRK